MRDRGEVLPVGDASVGWAFASSRAGSSHVRSDKPCQDAYALWSGSVAGQPSLIAAVADGHGDDRHDQSQFGAALAVRAAIEELLSLQTHIFGVGPSSRLVSSFKADFPRRLGKRWREAVIADAESRLLEGAEGIQDYASLFPRYGTTLLAALVVGKVLLVGQIGDGEAMVVRCEGSVDFPLACESEDVGMVTDSLCSAEAHRRWRTATLGCSDGRLILLGTDGLVNAFADQTQLKKFAQSFHDRIREHGPVEVAAALPGWLDHYSDQGSGDDITLAVVQVPAVQDEQRTAADTASTDFNDHSQGDAHVIGNRPAGIRGVGEDLLAGE
jgi:serine/threonine protein phosphatase PrpC